MALEVKIKEALSINSLRICVNIYIQQLSS